MLLADTTCLGNRHLVLLLVISSPVHNFICRRTVQYWIIKCRYSLIRMKAEADCTKLSFPLAPRRQMCYIDNRKGKARDTRPTQTIRLQLFYTAVTIASSGGYFFPRKIVWHNPTRVTMSIQNWIKSEYVTIGNPSFPLWSGGYSLRLWEGRPPLCVL